jgi:flagellar basal-body rod protein FlgG
MNQALWVAKTGLEAQELSMGMIANNLANANTVGHKLARPVFESLLYQTVRQPGGQTSADSTLPTGLMLGTGVKTVATQMDFKEGPVIQTGQQLDVMIEGRGFIGVTMPDGTIAYTRDGQLQLDSTGKIVTSSGYPLSSSITLPQQMLPGSLTISSDGSVSAIVAGNVAPTSIGSIELTDFINPAGLQPVGQNLYIETVSSGNPQSGTAGLNGFGSLRQGALEGSNVNVVEELVGLIETQRAYEMNSKAIAAIDQMMQYVSERL